MAKRGITEIMKKAARLGDLRDRRQLLLGKLFPVLDDVPNGWVVRPSATVDTSTECISRVRMKSLGSRGNTCVLRISRRTGDEKTVRSLSRSYSLRDSPSTFVDFDPPSSSRRRFSARSVSQFRRLFMFS